MKKRILLMFFIFAVLFMISCGENKTKKDVKPQNTGENASVEEVDENIADVKILPELPEINYNNYVFNIIVSGNMGTNYINDFHAEEETGDAIPDAVYRRNITVEDNFGVRINALPIPGNDAGQNAFKKSVLAQDHAYDAAMLGGYGASSLAMQGTLMDLNAVPWLDFTKPWWDQKAVKDLTIREKLFYMTGDFDTAANMDWTYCILFNKQIAQNYAVENLYELVKAGKWTVDKFAEYAQLVSVDLNGDGKMNRDDLYGTLVWDDSMMGIINAAGEKCAIVNSAGELELTLYTERALRIFEKYTKVVFDKNIAFGYQRVGEFGEEMFANNQALFSVKTLFVVTETRAMETDFGILPYFKLDETQSEYYNTVSSFFSRFLCVPMNQSGDELERTGIIMEAIAAESKYTVRPAYYERSLKGKYARDEDSEEMLDIIFNTRTYDLGWFYAIGGYNEGIMNLYRKYNNDFTSMYDKAINSANKKIDQINEKFAEILN